jgi:uncharacterized protein YkwD
MKTLILFIFISFVGFTQSLSTLIIQKVNKYRVQNHLKPLVVSDSVKLFNCQQLNYMVETSTVPLDHTQKIKTSYPKTFNTFTERINYIHKYGYNFVGENLYGGVYEGTENQMAEIIFRAWVNSPPHNQLLLEPNPTGIYVDYRITDKMIVNGITYDCCNFIYCVLTVYK